MYPFQKKLRNGKMVTFGQDKNGMHWAEIRDEYNLIESAATCHTPAQRNKWIEEREDDN